MKMLLAVFMLLINFFKAVIVSGLDTAIIILFKPGKTRSGMATVPYSNLNENTASLLGAMITLTPGTSLIEIDTESKQLLLHFLDLESKEETMALIERDFCKHLNVLNGVFS